VFVQWIGAGFVDRELVSSLLAALTESFAHVSIFRPRSDALIFLASDTEIDPFESAPRALSRAPRDFAKHGIHRLEDVAASWAIGDSGARAIAATNVPNSDDHNRLSSHFVTTA
jgi:hypothetical protein